MEGFEGFMKSFGFTQDPLIIIIIWALALMGIFAGGLFSNIILSFGGPIFERSMTQRTSFRLTLVSELFLIIYIAYYHTVLVPGIETAQMIFWGFMVLASPLLAITDAQLTYVAFAKKIDSLKRKGVRLERQQRKDKMAKATEEDSED